MTTQPTIMAVDDSPGELALLVKILTPVGYRVRPADCGELALTAVAANPPDLILLDVRMRGMNGLDVCRQLKTNPQTRHIPIILVSAFAEVSEWVAGLQLGAADYVTKPFQPEELLTRIRTHLALGQANASLAQQTEALRQANDQLHAEIVKCQLAETDRERLITELQAALAKVKQLQGILPVCSFCKKIRDPKGQWHPMEYFISDHSEAKFSHGLCPACEHEHYPDFAANK